MSVIKRCNVISWDKGNGYKAYIFKESTRRCAINYKGQGCKEVIYLRVADISCTRGIYESMGLSYRGPYSGVLWHIGAVSSSTFRLFFSFLYPKYPFYIYIVTTTLLELRLYKRGGSVMKPHHRGLHRRAPCSRVYLAYSLYQLRVGISPLYALNPYNWSRNVL